MTENEQMQLQRRSFFQSMFYSMAKSFFDEAGIEINGKRKDDIQVHSEEFYYQMAKFTMGFDRLALGESYVDGIWSVDDLAGFLLKCTENAGSFKKNFRFMSKLLHSLPLLWLNMQTKSQSKRDISAHYDIGNDLYKLMLDRSMNYSCAYWQKNVILDPPADVNNNLAELPKSGLCETLGEAQMNKMLLIGKKLNLQAGMTVLDIGCGWGYLAKFLAINFDVHVVGITISQEQFDYARSVDLKPDELEFLRVPSLHPTGTGSFEFRLLDYRDLDGQFDRIYSVGMFEHVGIHNYDQFFVITRNCLKDDGLLLLHTIGIGYTNAPQVEPWLNKYIFPGGMIPYHSQVGLLSTVFSQLMDSNWNLDVSDIMSPMIIEATQNRFSIEDWHNMGYDYYRTLICWLENFEQNWPALEDKYGQRFRRMWRYYLSFCAVTFQTRKTSLYQIVFSKRGFPGGYVSYR